MPQALLLYHFFHPDDVVSSRHFSDLAEGLAKRGWDVIAQPCNRGCRDESRIYSRSEVARSVSIRRVWRPGLPQAHPIGRALNAVWMLVAWSLAARRLAPDVVIVGTDPILSILVAIPWRLFRPQTTVVHWCFDLYPEAAVADGTLANRSILIKLLRSILRPAYRSCGLLVDLGPCMRSILSAYRSPAQNLTITPWALAEPARALKTNDEERQAIFGQTPLTLMYSGNFGRAHSYELILELARSLRDEPVGFAFSVRGNRAHELRSAVDDEDRNIGFVPFAGEERLEARLSAADIHIVSLRDEWTGTVVPSKFFGALAAGRPVLFVGSSRSSVAIWIRQHKVGWVLDGTNLPKVRSELISLAQNPLALKTLFSHCHAVYAAHFSEKKGIDTLETELRKLTSTADLPALELQLHGR